MKNPVCLVQRAVKILKKTEVRHFYVHAAKITLNFGFRKPDFGFFYQLCVNKSEMENPNSEIQKTLPL